VNKAALIDTAERVARTTLQASAAAILALWIQAGSFDEIDWNAMWKVGLFAAGLTLLTAIVGNQTGSKDNTSFVTPKEDGP
jgi:hypothetical protein